jgi:hypothetical protein
LDPSDQVVEEAGRYHAIDFHYAGSSAGLFAQSRILSEFSPVFVKSNKGFTRYVQVDSCLYQSYPNLSFRSHGADEGVIEADGFREKAEDTATVFAQWIASRES